MYVVRWKERSKSDTWKVQHASINLKCNPWPKLLAPAHVSKQLAHSLACFLNEKSNVMNVEVLSGRAARQAAKNAG